MQRKLLVARKELATKLKDSVDKPILIIKNNDNVKTARVNTRHSKST